MSLRATFNKYEETYRVVIPCRRHVVFKEKNNFSLTFSALREGYRSLPLHRIICRYQPRACTSLIPGKNRMRRTELWPGAPLPAGTWSPRQCHPVFFLLWSSSREEGTAP